MKSLDQQLVAITDEVGTTTADLQKSERELPGAPYDSAFGDDRNKNRDRQGLAELGYTRAVTDRVTVAARIYGNKYRFNSTLIRPEGT